MLREWYEQLDEVVEAPESMATLDGTARRRTWRRETSARRWYDLSAFLGLDRDEYLVVVWECDVWVGLQQTDHMHSSCRHYGWKPARVTGGKFARETAMRALSPLEVTGYTAWGSVLPGVRT